MTRQSPDAMVIRRIVSHRGRTSWLLTGLRVTALNTKVVLASRPRFTDARNPRPSRHWNQNGIKLIKCHPPTCACHQAECHLLHQIERRAPHKVSHLSGTIAFVSKSRGFNRGLYLVVPRPCHRVRRGSNTWILIRACDASQRN